MKMIKPVVNISKIMNAHDVIVCGLNGVIYDGNSFNSDAIDALIRLRKNGKQVVLLSNTSMRISELVDKLYASRISPMVFNNIITMISTYSIYNHFRQFITEQIIKNVWRKIWTDVKEKHGKQFSMLLPSCFPKKISTK